MPHPKEAPQTDSALCFNTANSVSPKVIEKPLPEQSEELFPVSQNTYKNTNVSILLDRWPSREGAWQERHTGLLCCIASLHLAYAKNIADLKFSIIYSPFP